MPYGAGMSLRQIPARAGLTSGQIPGVRPGGGMMQLELTCTLDCCCVAKAYNIPKIFTNLHN